MRNSLVVREPRAIVHNPYIFDWSVYDFSWYDGIASTSKSDREIKNNIENELWWIPFIDDDSVKIFVEGGVATMTGTVKSWTEFNVAADNAFDGGAVSVINKLTFEE